MKFILGTKLNMTQVFAGDGKVLPVTRVQAGPCVVTQLVEKNKRTSIEIGYGAKKHITKPAAGHAKGETAVRFIRRFRVEAVPAGVETGSRVTVSTFTPGDHVMVTGISKGKGFQGVVKRHGFHGQPTSHGHKDQERMPGSIGPTGPQRVFKDMKMAGRMGTDRVTVKNLEIISIDAEKNEILIKGAIPGATGSLVMIQGEGELKIEETATEAPAQEVIVEEVKNPEPEAPVAPEEPAVIENVVETTEPETPAEKSEETA